MTPPQKWERIRTGKSADHRVLKVREDTVADPRNGSHHARVIIESSDWVNIIPVTLDDEVVLVRQFRFGIWENTLEIPGGMVDPGEAPMDAALRELEEETAYVAGRVVPLGTVHPNPAIQTNRCHTFLAIGCDRTGSLAPDSGEDIEVVLVPRRNIPRMLRDGTITHSLVVAAFGLERLYWDQQTSYKEE